jgi:hypothetical protein
MALFVEAFDLLSNGLAKVTLDQSILMRIANYYNNHPLHPITFKEKFTTIMPS